MKQKNIISENTNTLKQLHTLRVNRIKQLKYLTLIFYQISVTKGVKLRFNLPLTEQLAYTI